MRPPHKTDAKNRATVEAMISYGIPQEDIAAVLKIDKKTLRKHYRDEIDTATAKANSQVGQRLYQKALQGDVASMIFWLKTRAKWSETIKNENRTVDENGNTIDTQSLVCRFISSKKK